MTRTLAALALALSLASSSAVALAAPAKADAARHVKKDERDEKKFPMKADEFKKHIAERVAKGKERMEKHITEKKVDEAKAKEIRAKFEAGVARINKKVDEVSADGSVTLEEAKQVHAVMREVMPHHKKGDHKKKSDKK